MGDPVIPTSWLGDTPSKNPLHVKEDTVKLTMRSSKGLECQTVAKADVGEMGFEDKRAAGEAPLLHVAMTQAMEDLLLSSCNETSVPKRLGQSLKRMSSRKSA